TNSDTQNTITEFTSGDFILGQTTLVCEVDIVGEPNLPTHVTSNRTVSNWRTAVSQHKTIIAKLCNAGECAGERGGRRKKLTVRLFRLTAAHLEDTVLVSLLPALATPS
ncbi:hypothetical protein L9F63_012293, partial [Diploptera punctata]